MELRDISCMMQLLRAIIIVNPLSEPLVFASTAFANFAQIPCMINESGIVCCVFYSFRAELKWKNISKKQTKASNPYCQYIRDGKTEETALEARASSVFDWLISCCRTLQGDCFIVR